MSPIFAVGCHLRRHLIPRDVICKCEGLAGLTEIIASRDETAIHLRKKKGKRINGEPNPKKNKLVQANWKGKEKKKTSLCKDKTTIMIMLLIIMITMMIIEANNDIQLNAIYNIY